MECLLVLGEIGKDLLEQLLRELDVHMENLSPYLALCFKQANVGIFTPSMCRR